MSTTARTRPVQFTRESAERIARVVRGVELSAPPASPLDYDPRLGSDGGRGKTLTLATFKGAWATGESRVVTLAGSTQTASVTNYCEASRGDGNSKLNVVFGRSSAGNTVVEIDPGPVISQCGNIQGPDLVRITFASCYGSGGEARLLSPSGSIANAGPMGSLQILDPGSGYAVPGRSAPSLSVSGGGIDAVFTVATAQTTDACLLPYWTISSVTVKDGVGYVQGETLKVSPLGDSIQHQGASLTLNTKRSQPELGAEAAGGSGASFSVGTGLSTYSTSMWSVTSILASGGSNYPDQAKVTVTLGKGDVQHAPAAGIARTKREPPSLQATVLSYAGFGGAASITLGTSTDGEGRQQWSVAGLAVANKGKAYAAGDMVEIGVLDGQIVPGAQGAAGYVAGVSADGSILSFGIHNGGAFFKNTGVLESVVVTEGGAYYKEQPDTVKVNSGGLYYRNDYTKSPHVSPVSAVITQYSPSNGTGAKITPTIETDYSSSDFGRIVNLTIDNPGTAYLAWVYTPTLVFGGADLTKLNGWKAGEVQVLAHTGENCLQWYDVTTCSTATASP